MTIQLPAVLPESLLIQGDLVLTWQVATIMLLFAGAIGIISFAWAMERVPYPRDPSWCANWFDGLLWLVVRISVVVFILTCFYAVAVLIFHGTIPNLFGGH